MSRSTSAALAGRRMLWQNTVFCYFLAFFQLLFMLLPHVCSKSSEKFANTALNWPAIRLGGIPRADQQDTFGETSFFNWARNFFSSAEGRDAQRYETSAKANKKQAEEIRFSFERKKSGTGSVSVAVSKPLGPNKGVPSFRLDLL